MVEKSVCFLYNQTYREFKKKLLNDPGLGGII